MRWPTKQALAVVKELARLFRIENENTDQPYIFAHMEDIRPLVESLLIQKPLHRDSDSRLYHDVLVLMGEVPRKITAFDLLRKIHYGELPHWEAVSRVKREIQFAHPDLRGKVWPAVTDIDSTQQLPFDEGLEK